MITSILLQLLSDQITQAPPLYIGNFLDILIKTWQHRQADPFLRLPVLSGLSGTNRPLWRRRRSDWSCCDADSAALPFHQLPGNGLGPACLSPEQAKHQIGGRRYATIAGKYGGGVFCNLPDGTVCMCNYSYQHEGSDFMVGDTVIIVVQRFETENGRCTGKS